MNRKPTYHELRERVRFLEKERARSGRVELNLEKNHDSYVENMLQAMFDATHDNAVLLSLSGKTLAINATAAGALGRQPHEIIGKDIYTFFPHRVVAFRKEQARKAVLEQKPVSFSEKTKGTILHWNLYPVFSKNKEIVSLAIFGQDVTERTKTEDALREREAQYRGIFEAASDSFVILDMDGIIVDVNSAAHEMLGYSREELIGLSFKNVVHPGSYHLFEAFKRDVREKRMFQSEATGIKKDGTAFPVDVRGSLFVYKGKPHLLAVVRDNSREKTAEAKLIKTKNFLKNILDNSIDGITRTDARGKIRYTSPKVSALLGYDPKEVIGVNAARFFAGGRKDVETIIRKLGTGGELTHHDIALKKKNGGLLYFSLSASLIKDDSGKVIGAIGIYRDISEKKRLEEQFRQAQKVEAVGTLAAGIAHQFNNALTAITGNIGLMEMDLADDRKFSRNIADMKTSAHRMANLTSQLLAYARGGQYHLQETPMRDFLQNTLPLIEYTLNPSVRLETDLPMNLMNIKADRTQMQMVISAIVDNANEAIQGKGRISVSAENVEVDAGSREGRMKPGPYVRLTISDDGKGMDEETRSRIFDPFFTTHFIGRGLGMAAVYGIVTNHGGSISVESQPGRGTRVHISLPAIQVKDFVAEKPGEMKHKEPLQGEGTILVIEDEPDVMEITRETLERLGYGVIEAATGKNAVKKALSFDGPIDAALLDIKLPDMTGDRLYPLIMEARPDLKVIVFSGYALDGPARDILNAGADGFVQKPFSVKGLSEKLKEVLRT